MEKVELKIGRDYYVEAFGFSAREGQTLKLIAKKRRSKSVEIQKISI